MTTSKYIMMKIGGDGLAFIDFIVTYGGLALDGQDIQFLGSSLIDAVFVRPGASYVLNTGGGADRIYVEGQLSDYTLSRNNATLILTRTVDGKVETVHVAGANATTAPDVLVFSDGSVSVNALYTHVADGTAAPVPTGETSLAPQGAAARGAVLDAIVKIGCFNPAGETVAASKPGVAFQILGSAGVDRVYVAEGTTIDAASLGGGVDVVYFRGQWADYTKTLTGARLTLTRTVSGHVETIVVASSGGTLNDLLVFADGAVRSQVAGQGVKADANVALADLAGFDPSVFVDLVAPVAPRLSLANDNGTSQTDGLTNDGHILVTLLEAGASWTYSIDGGQTWLKGEGETFSLATGTYAADQIQVRQRDAAGNLSEAGHNETVLTIDSTPPVAPVISGFLDPIASSINPSTGAIINLVTSPVAGASVLQQGATSLHGTGTAGSKVVVTFGASEQRVVTVDVAGAWSLNLTHADIVSFGIGAEAFTATVSDDAGNSASTTVPLQINAQAYTTNDVAASGYGSEYVDALIIGEAGWSGGIITYSFSAGSGASVWSESEKSAVRSALALYENIANLDFQETDDYGEAAGGANIALEKSPASTWTEPGILADFTIPFGGYNATQVGRFNYEISYWQNLSEGGLAFDTLVHELGHALGLGHPFTDTINGVTQTQFPGVAANDAYALGTLDLNQGIWTIMSYNFGWDVKAPPNSYAWGLSKTPMVFDVAAIQAIYGANLSYRTGNDVYTLPTASKSGTGWACIWDAGGVDTISNAGSSLNCVINLNAYPLTAGIDPTLYVLRNLAITGGYTIAAGAVIENAVGGGGRDTIIGNHVSNLLTGGGAADQFIFNTALGASNVDSISDFSVSAGDVIALDKSIFDRLSNLSDLSGHFGYSTQSADPDLFVIYDTGSGTLSYRDEANELIDFAILLSKPQSITATSFAVL
ncbi:MULTISPECIES: M10 family metallopeptidase C-terminal domain-containing protein [Sphingobium]|uniref:M10 family metallopeptidase C-terminal domain-containing protein n=1 Tax=Sphingobium TaxID=165695 RepID=UPI0015EC164B|nr:MULTISPECIES: M10 family metallopeptidase C-terminal domain-containing protein [Sphingobium]MCW2361309.1 hypothetical protein [Sphingobium sp. B10D3B]MCW2402012.1 hypothetical protein [Sphingobium sp. B10D7B]MCW2408991.1 hypothetical protein [Sphingobium xanthum]